MFWIVDKEEPECDGNTYLYYYKAMGWLLKHGIFKVTGMPA